MPPGSPAGSGIRQSDDPRSDDPTIQSSDNPDASLPCCPADQVPWLLAGYPRGPVLPRIPPDSPEFPWEALSASLCFLRLSDPDLCIWSCSWFWAPGIFALSSGHPRHRQDSGGHIALTSYSATMMFCHMDFFAKGRSERKVALVPGVFASSALQPVQAVTASPST